MKIEFSTPVESLRRRVVHTLFGDDGIGVLVGYLSVALSSAFLAACRLNFACDAQTRWPNPTCAAC